MHKPSALLQTMIDAARAAGEGLRADFANLKRLEIKTKAGHGDPVSIADTRAEETINSVLRARYPLAAAWGHEHIAPGRKTDPGPAFNWTRFSRDSGFARRQLPPV